MKKPILTHETGRKLGVGFLTLCFGLSSVNAALATEAVDVSPIIVQPDDLRDISQQMLEQDRVNRDQELAIRGLIDDNQRLTETALARQQDATLDQIDQTLVKYRDSLISRDQMRIAVNSQRVSKYHDLIRLTEDVDDMKDAGRTLQLKSNVIEDKYKILSELKEELIALNEKLKGQAVHENFVSTYPQQMDKIQMLTQKLGEMDQKIARYDEILVEKDRQIAQLKDDLAAKDEIIKNLSSKAGIAQPQVNQAAWPSDLQAQLKAKDESIRWLNQVLAATKSKAEYYRLTSQQDKMALQQVQQEVQKIRIEFAQQFKNYDQFENALGSIKIEAGRLGMRLAQKQEQVDLLKSELENKITEINSEDRLKLAHRLINAQRQEIALLEEKNRIRADQNTDFDTHLQDLEKNQGVLADQISDLKADLQDKENQITTMKAAIKLGQQTQFQSDILKDRLADEQNKVALLKQELDSKNAQSNQMTAMISDYQQKLEAKNNAYNQELQQVLLTKNDRARDLSLSTTEQKMTDEKVKEYQDKINTLKSELALARQQLEGMPSSDEIDFLRTGLKKATMQLKQKDEMLTQVKANADEYEKEFKEQSSEFQSLKAQLQDATDDIARKNEDLKYKNLALVRLKERSIVQEGDLMDQVKALTRKLEAVEKNSGNKALWNKTEAQLILPSKNDPLREKLIQALNKIDEQGRLISVLVKKLQDAGQTVNLTQDTAKE